MREISLGRILRAALLAGIVAGLAAAAFHFLATEPTIDHAIHLEELRVQTGGAPDEPMVSRDLQKVGLFIGFVIYGLTWSLLLGAVFHAAQRWLPGASAARRAYLLAAAGFWSVAFLPSLKYPANPPGVGDPETITSRQLWYLALLALSLVGTAVALGFARRRHWAVVLAGLAVYAAVVYVVLPASTDQIGLPADVVWTFRILSVLGLAVFWAVLGLAFGFLLQRQSARPVVRPRAATI